MTAGDRYDWGSWYLDFARTVATRSRDPSTKCGAAIVRPDNTLCSIGYNGFPRGLADLKGLYEDREEKYKRIIHAEMNAILTAREPLHGYILYVVPFPPCERCAVHIIQSGIAHIVCPPPTEEAEERWGHSWDLARNLYEEAGLTYEEVPF